MTRLFRDRIVRRLDEAEGYLMLGLPQRALEALQSRSEWATMQFQASLLTGLALRALGRHREAIPPLEVAAALRPDDVEVAVALGWCYKRTHRLAQAIDALERARKSNPGLPILHYNLACYWSLIGNTARAIGELATALELAPEMRRQVGDEPDFDPVRHQPAFQRLIYGQAPLTEKPE